MKDQQARLQAVLKNLHYDEAVVIGSIFGEISKALDNSVKFIKDITGSCPADYLGYKLIDCENECSKRRSSECWREYFEKGCK